MSAAVLAIDLTESIAAYMKVKFQNEIQDSKATVKVPSSWNSSMLYECHLALNVLVQAFANRSKDIIFLAL